MAFRDLAGPTAAERWVAYRAPAMSGRWRGAARWADRPVGALDRRPLPPSRRLGRARMRRTAFLILALGWASAVATLLIASLVVRAFG